MTVIMTMILERGAFLKGRWLIKTIEMGERNGQTAWKEEKAGRLRRFCHNLPTGVVKRYRYGAAL
jgi:hypothetical protein